MLVIQGISKLCVDLDGKSLQPPQSDQMVACGWAWHSSSLPQDSLVQHYEIPQTISCGLSMLILTNWSPLLRDPSKWEWVPHLHQIYYWPSSVTSVCFATQFLQILIFSFTNLIIGWWVVDFMRRVDASIFMHIRCIQWVIDEHQIDS